MIALLAVLLAQAGAGPIRFGPQAPLPPEWVQPGSGSRATFINVRAAPYFAVGDGVADDTAAIQTVLNTAQTVVVPKGTYKISSTLAWPVASNGTTKLLCDAGTVLSYTGSGHAIEFLGTGQPYANVHIERCRVTGTSSGLSGIHLRAMNSATVVRARCDGFTIGAGILNEGGNAIELIATDLVGNKDGLRNVGVVVNASNYSANAVTMKGGQINGNSRWGVFEDASLAGTVGPNIGNRYTGVVFSGNGTNGVALSGHAFVQRADSVSFRDSYFEYTAGNTVPYAITVGDGSNVPRGLVIRGNWFGSLGAIATINNVNGQALVIDGNIEAAAITNFVLQGASAVTTTVGPNSYSAVATPFGGTDSGNNVFWGSGSNIVNAMQPGVRGFQFNTISGLDSDLKIRMRNGGTNLFTFENDGGTFGGIDSAGKIRFGSVAQASLGTPVNGNVVYCSDCTIANPCASGGTGAFAQRINGAWVCDGGPASAGSEHDFSVYNAANLGAATALSETVVTNASTTTTASKITTDIAGVGAGNFVAMLCTDGTACAAGNQRLTCTQACTAVAGTRTACTVQNGGTIAAGTTVTWSVTTACATADPGVNINAHITTP